MCAVGQNQELESKLKDFLERDFCPQYDVKKRDFQSVAKWQKLLEIDTKLWLDSGDIEQIGQAWTREFSGLTVNNTLLNKEIQAGRFDDFIPEIVKFLDDFPKLDDRQKLLEVNFALNVRHGLRLVEKFDGYVSLEEHTDLADDVALAVDYGRRYYAICPQRFYVKIPFTAAGLLATRKLAAEGVPVNHTLGFSARQNYLIARIAKPAFVNVFLGRLNSVIADNDLGSGDYVGEKATLASQKAIRQLRAQKLTPSRQIGASLRSGRQVWDLAGIDVMTIPPKVAREFLELDIGLDVIEDRSDWAYQEGVKDGLDHDAVRLDTLWDIDDTLVACVDALEQENVDSFTPNDLYEFFKKHRCADILVKWEPSHVETSYHEGKIPRLDHWADALKSQQIGLDSLMNLAGLNSFRADQKATDQRVMNVTSQHK